jgi:MoaA/NifB/PqqE/SkfB family radical SAM enzyme
MCDIWKLDTRQEISAAELERHMADIVKLGVEWVVFSGGEPLMHSDLFRLSAMLRARGVRTTILSTGLLLERYASKIVEHADDVIVSLDGPAEVHNQIRRVPRAFALLAAGVRAVLESNPRFPIAARCTVQRSNFMCLRATAAAARQLDLRSISFLAADVTTSAFNRPDGWLPERTSTVAPRLEDLPQLEQEMEALISEWGASGFVLESPAKLRRIVLHFRAHLGLSQPVAPRCNAPWVSAVVETDGTVRPCFFHRPLGQLSGNSLQAVLNGPEAIAFRQRLDVGADPICRRCVCSLYRPMEEEAMVTSSADAQAMLPALRH